MYKRTQKRSAHQESKLQLSAMVDVVFLLLIFFVVTLQTEDILAELPISKPGTSDIDTPVKTEPLLRIQVMPDTYYINNKVTSLEALDASFSKLFKHTKNSDIMLICSEDSPHSQLINLLDICAKHNLKKLHLFSQ